MQINIPTKTEAYKRAQQLNDINLSITADNFTQQLWILF